VTDKKRGKSRYLSAALL